MTATATHPAGHPAADVGADTDADGTFDHGAISRFNAWFFTTFDRYVNVITRRHKQHAFEGLLAGTIVELGAGVGANFDYIPPGSRVIAVEPSRAMHAELQRRAVEREIDLELVGAAGERLPIPSASADAVICSLVLCTVDDPRAVLAEVRRVLRPGGTFRFVEHVAAHPASPRRWLQATLRRPWSWLYEGCRLCRDTASHIEAAGFEHVEIERRRFRRSLFVPVNTAISGIAVA